MKNLIIGLVVGFLMGAVVTGAIASTDQNIEYIFNRVWDTSTDTLRIVGQ